MKIPLLVLSIAILALCQVKANNDTTVSRCNATKTTIREVLKTTMEELYHETIQNLEIKVPPLLVIW